MRPLGLHHKKVPIYVKLKILFEKCTHDVTGIFSGRHFYIYMALKSVAYMYDVLTTFMYYVLIVKNWEHESWVLEVPLPLTWQWI